MGKKRRRLRNAEAQLEIGGRFGFHVIGDAPGFQFRTETNVKTYCRSLRPSVSWRLNGTGCKRI